MKIEKGDGFPLPQRQSLERQIKCMGALDSFDAHIQCRLWSRWLVETSGLAQGVERAHSTHRRVDVMPAEVGGDGEQPHAKAFRVGEAGQADKRFQGSLLCDFLRQERVV